MYQQTVFVINSAFYGGVHVNTNNSQLLFDDTRYLY